MNKFVSPVSYKKHETYFSNVRQDIPAMITGRPNKILEVGCAEGGMGQLIKNEIDCEYIGMDIKREACLEAQKRLDRVINADVEKSKLAEFGLDERSFDYILYGDVLEHLHDPWTVIYEHSKYLKDDGYVIGSIPNIGSLAIVDSLANGNWTYKESGILDATHLRFFTFHEVKKMFTDCGFQIEEIVCNTLPFIDLKNFQGNVSIDSPRVTIKNVTKEEAVQLCTQQFVVKAYKLNAQQTACDPISARNEMTLAQEVDGIFKFVQLSEVSANLRHQFCLK